MKNTFLEDYFEEQINAKQPKLWKELFTTFQAVMKKLPENKRSNLKTLKAEYKAVNGVLDRSEEVWCFTSYSTDIINLDDEPKVFTRLSNDPEELNQFIRKVKSDEYTYLYWNNDTSKFEVYLSVSSLK